MTTKPEKSEDFQKGVPLLPRASKSVVREAAKGSDTSKTGNSAIPSPEAAKDGAGMPAGYKPDTSVSYHASKDGKSDTIKTADGVQDVTSHNANMGGNQLEQLPPGNTYRDRVEAQARSLGVSVVEGETLELLMWKIRMQASS